MVAPVLEQSGGLRGHLPCALRPVAPLRDLLAYLVDDGGDIVLPSLGRQALALVEHHRGLGRGGLALPGLGDGGDELGAAAVLKNSLCRLPVGVEFPMATRILVGELSMG